MDTFAHVGHQKNKLFIIYELNVFFIYTKYNMFINIGVQRGQRVHYSSPLSIGEGSGVRLYLFPSSAKSRVEAYYSLHLVEVVGHLCYLGIEKVCLGADNLKIG